MMVTPGQLEGDDGDAGATELDVFVVDRGDGGDSAGVFLDLFVEDAVAFAVDDADLGHAEHDGIVDVVHDGVEGLVQAGAAYVDFRTEGELSLCYFATYKDGAADSPGGGGNGGAVGGCHGGRGSPGRGGAKV